MFLTPRRGREAEGKRSSDRGEEAPREGNASLATFAFFEVVGGSCGHVAFGARPNNEPAVHAGDAGRFRAGRVREGVL